MVLEIIGRKCAIEAAAAADIVFLAPALGTASRYVKLPQGTRDGKIGRKGVVKTTMSQF